MGGNSGRKTKKIDPIRSKAAKKAWATRWRTKITRKSRWRKARERAPVTFSIGLSKSAGSKLQKLASKETGGMTAKSKALEKLIRKGGRFVTAERYQFRISKTVLKELNELKNRTNLSEETIIESLLKRR
jgi:hypothetical protein